MRVREKRKRAGEGERGEEEERSSWLFAYKYSVSVASPIVSGLFSRAGVCVILRGAVSPCPPPFVERAGCCWGLLL